jgi:hypothetical protein
MKILTILFLALATMNALYSQEDCSFCRAVEKGNFQKAERIFKREVKKRKNGTSYYNGPGSGMQVTHQYNIDTLTLWLKNKPCVKEATWDECQNKPAIYPGWAVIGAKFNTRFGSIEKCFYLQEGTMGTLHVFGWKPHLFKSRNILMLKRVAYCEGFIEEQEKKCKN